MEPQYKNTYQPSEALFLEYAKALRAKWKNVLALLAMVLFGVNLVISLVGGYYSYALVAVIGLAACGLLLATPLLRAKSLLSTAVELGGGRLQPSTLVFDDAMHLQEGEFTMDFAYADISNVKQSEHLFILMLGPHDTLMVHKQGFTLGDPDKFYEFLQAQCRAVMESPEIQA